MLAQAAEIDEGSTEEAATFEQAEFVPLKRHNPVL